MIAGIGTDLVETDRVWRAYEKPGFRRRVYTKEEEELIGNNRQRAAGNFAAKEAVAKALGSGFSGFYPSDIEILRDAYGAPYVNLYGEARVRFEALHLAHIYVSISHVDEMAMATAVAEREQI